MNRYVYVLLLLQMYVHMTPEMRIPQFLIMFLCLRSQSQDNHCSYHRHLCAARAVILDSALCGKRCKDTTLDNNQQGIHRKTFLFCTTFHHNATGKFSDYSCKMLIINTF